MAEELNHDRRREPRYPFQQQFVVERIDGSLVATTESTAKARNISHHGLGFVHVAPLSVGMPCFVKLPTLEGDIVNLAGTVMHCDLLGPNLHFVGVQWSTPIDLNDYLEVPG